MIVNGQQTATSTYPCPYCFVTLSHLRNVFSQSGDKLLSADDDQENDSRIECTTLKTYGDIKKDFAYFCSMGKEKKNAKFSNSTVNLPLFDEDDNTCVLEKCIIPELHILQGFVNHVFWNGLVPILDRERALLWPKKLSWGNI